MRTLVIATTALALVATLAVSGCGGRTKADEKARSSDAEQLYGEATRQLNIGGYPQAVALLERMELYFPFSEYTRRGQLDLIYAYYKSGDEESAIDAANEFIRENPTHPDVDYAYYLRGLIFFDRQRNPIEKAFRVDLSQRPTAKAQRSLSYFAELVRRYPDSEYADDARQRMIYLRERLASFDLHVARYYMSRSAWLAAANRARNVVETYQDTAAVGEALDLMARAYRNLGMDDLARDAERVLAENNLRGTSEQSGKRLFRRARPLRPAADGNDG